MMSHSKKPNRFRFLEVLKDICLEIASEPNLDDVLTHLTGRVAQTIDAEICSLFLRDDADPNWLVLRAAHRYPEMLVGQRTHRVGEGITGHIVETKAHQRFDSFAEIKRHHKHAGRLDEKRGGVCETFLGYPICYRDELAIGTLKVENKRPGKMNKPRIFTPGDEIVLETICGVLAVKFKNEEIMREIWKANYIADFFHTFRSPLFTVRGTCQQLTKLLKEGRDVPDYEGRVRNALVEALRFEQLVNNSAFWTQKKSVFSDADLNLSEAAKSVVLRYMEAAKFSGTEFRFKESPRSGGAGTGTIRTNQQTFELILCNLLDNAIKYGGGAVTCSLGWSPDCYDLVVEDNGPGMTDNEKRLAKQARYRGDASHGTDGLGLGLSVCERALHGLGGEMTFEDVQPKGLRVKVTCPASSPHAITK